MEIRRLLYFSRIAEDGSLTKAAGVLRVAQPALSRQLRLLEDELGVALFTRTARGMRLTDEGEYLREAVAGPLRALEFALQNVRSLASGAQGSLVFGMTSSLGDVLATRLVLALNARFPDIKLRMIEGATGSLMEWLNRGIVDCALIEDAADDERLVGIEMASVPLMVIGGPRSDLSEDRPVSMRKLLQLPLILPSHHLGIRATINQAAAKARVTLTPVFEADQTKLIMDLAESGAGFALLPRLFCEDHVRQGRLRCAPLTPEQAFRIVLSAKRRDRPGNQNVADALRGTLRTLLSELAGERPSARDAPPCSP
jgi:LysR family nitrogen assimilation transcriptional regulator